MRVKAIHVMNVSTPFRFVLNLVTRMFSQKVIGKRERRIHRRRKCRISRVGLGACPHHSYFRSRSAAVFMYTPTKRLYWITSTRKYFHWNTRNSRNPGLSATRGFMRNCAKTTIGSSRGASMEYRKPPVIENRMLPEALGSPRGAA